MKLKQQSATPKGPAAGLNATDNHQSLRRYTDVRGMDYEHDEYGTPRIAAVVDKGRRLCALGTVRKDAILVREFDLGLGEALYVATYEHNYPSEQFRDDNFQVADAEEACEYIIGRGVFSTLERPISAACAFEDKDGFSVAFKDAT